MDWPNQEHASSEGPTGPARRDPARRRSARVAGGMRASMVLVGLNVVAFLIAQPGPGGLFALGVMHVDSVLQGEIWRLLGACFLHWGSTHLLLNMIGLIFFGGMLERTLGTRRFLVLYLGSGVLANAVYVLLYLLGWSGAGGLAAGASGGVYAVLGATAVLLPHIRVLVFLVIPMNIRTFLFLFVVWGVFNVLSQGPNAGGDAVHLAGLAVGLGYAVRVRRGLAGTRTPVDTLLTIPRDTHDIPTTIDSEAIDNLGAIDQREESP